MDKQNRIRNLLFAIITVGLSLFFSFVVLELLVANFLSADMETVSKEFDATLGWRNVPGEYKVRRANSLVPHHIHINELGLRSTNTPHTSEDTAVRIIVLGDSFTFAKAVGQEDIFTSRLESRLNQQMQNRYEVINAGVEGYGNAQQLLFLKKLTEQNLVADIYVLQIFTNDILDNLRLEYGTKSINSLKPGYVLDQENRLILEDMPLKKDRLPHQGKRSKQSALQTFRVMGKILETRLQSNPDLVKLAMDLGIDVEFPRMPGVVNAWYDRDVLERGVPLMKELIREIKSEVEQQNAKLLVVFIPSPLMIYRETYGPLLEKTFPSHPQVDEFLADITKPQRVIKQICDEISVPLLDMYPILMESNDRGLYFPGEGHLTGDGHSVVASSLDEELRKTFLP